MFKVTATVPQPMYDPRRPYFAHEPSTAPTRKLVYPNGSKDRKISVTTKNAAVALALSKVLEKVFIKVIVQERNS